MRVPAVILQNGSIYDGQWLDKQKHGYGFYIGPDGSCYEGNINKLSSIN